MNSHPPTILYPRAWTPTSSCAVGTALDQIAYAILCALTFVLPWETSIGPRFIPILGVMVIGMTLLRTVVLAQARKLCELQYFMLAFVMWSGASVLWTLDLDSTITRLGTYAQLLLLAWAIWVLADSESRVLKLLQLYVFGTYVTAIGTISNVIAGHTTQQLTEMEPGDRYMMSGMNPNATGLLLVPSIPMTLYLLAKQKRSPAMTLLLWLQLVLCFTTVFLSGSRGALLAAAPTSVMFLITVFRLPWWQRVLAVMAIAAIVVCGSLLVPSDTWQRNLRLGTDLVQGTMTHRTEIWRASVELFRDHAFLGVGANAHAAAVVELIGRPLVAHNTFLSVLVELGIIGELLLLGLLGAAFYCVLQMPRLERALWILTLAAWCIAASSATSEYHKGTWFLWSLLAAHAYLRRDTARVVLV